MIENLGAALDQYDTIDFSDNEIRKLDGFPFMNRVKSLMMNNNRIVRSVNPNNSVNLQEYHLNYISSGLERVWS